MHATLTEHFFKSMLDESPDLIFWKNTKSEFLGCNQKFALLAGFNNPDDLVGKTDWEMSWKQFASKYQADDQHVLKGNHLSTIENIHNLDGGLEVLYIKKSPVYDAQSTAIGVFCYAKILSTTPRLLSTASDIAKDPTFSGLVVVEPSCIKKYYWGLTQVQSETLYYIIRGYSSAQIAEHLCRGKRSIDSRIDVIKTKTNCCDKLELIEKSIRHGFASIIPSSLIPKTTLINQHDASTLTNTLNRVTSIDNSPATERSFSSTKGVAVPG